MNGQIHVEGKGVVLAVRVPVTEETLFSPRDVVLDAAVAYLNEAPDVMFGLGVATVRLGTAPLAGMVPPTQKAKSSDMWTAVLAMRFWNTTNTGRGYALQCRVYD